MYWRPSGTIYPAIEGKDTDKGGELTSAYLLQVGVVHVALRRPAKYLRSWS